MFCAEVCGAEGGAGLAVALAEDGVLRLAAERCLDLATRGEGLRVRMWPHMVAHGQGALVRAKRAAASARHSQLRLGRGQATLLHVPVSPLPCCPAACPPQLQLGTAMLLREVCGTLDAHAGTRLVRDHASVLRGVPHFERVVVWVEKPSQGEGSYAVDLEALERAPWSKRFRQPAAWKQVAGRLLPAVEAACKPLAAEGGPLANGVFHDIGTIAPCTAAAAACWGLVGGATKSLLPTLLPPAHCRLKALPAHCCLVALPASPAAVAGAGTCCSPSCTNLGGAREAELKRSTCGRCLEATYCGRSCQRRDHARHKLICAELKKLK